MRMLLSACCLTSLFFEYVLNIKILMTIVFLQSWIFAEWLAFKKKEDFQYDILLHDILPFLAQIIIFYKSIFVTC
jgi:hypothetical protein